MSDPQVTQLLNAVSAGNEDARDQLLRPVYDELRKLARIKMLGERKEHTLQPTVLEISRATLKRDRVYARRWLYERMSA